VKQGGEGGGGETFPSAGGEGTKKTSLSGVFVERLWGLSHLLKERGKGLGPSEFMMRRDSILIKKG